MAPPININSHTMEDHHLTNQPPHILEAPMTIIRPHIMEDPQTNMLFRTKEDPLAKIYPEDLKATLSMHCPLTSMSYHITEDPLNSFHPHTILEGPLTRISLLSV